LVKSIVDVTESVNFGSNDEEILPLTRCVCGKEFDYWGFVLNIYPTNPAQCPSCKRKLFFAVNIAVYEIKED
jgi:DNA-directed RNA polymerase subunit RPC12/RpoP